MQLVHALKADLMHRTTAVDFCESKEMWFFENLNLRNRKRLLLQAANCLKVQVAEQRDIYAHAQDPMQKLAVESCGTCTEFFDRAMVFDRTSNRNLHIDDYANTARPVDAIRHFKGCVDLARHTGSVSVYVSAADGVVVLTPEAQLRSARGIDNDQCMFPAATGACAHSLFPVLNVAEDRADHNDKVRVEVHTHAHLSLDDITHHSLYTRTVLSDSVMKMLDARDSCGFGMFYAVQYAPPLPIMLYPHTTLAFVAASRGDILPSQPAPAAPAAQNVHTHRPQPAARHHTVADCMCAGVHATMPAVVFEFDDAEHAHGSAQHVALAWDEATVSTIQAMTMPRGAGLCATYLVPIAEYRSARAT